MAVYSFQKQLALGQQQEARLDRHFESGFLIQPTTMDDQRRGIDRWFTSRDDQRTIGVEYKADFKSHTTGNAFIETVSVGRYVDDVWTVEKPGWVATSQAAYLMYLVVGTGKVYITRPTTLRKKLSEWQDSHRSVQVRNNGYQGRGLLVPLDVLECVAVKTLEIS